MNRHIGWVMLLVIGILLGNAINSYQTTHAQVPASAISDDDLVKLANELKGIGADVKDINTLLHKGSIKVVVIINADQADQR